MELREIGENKNAKEWQGFGVLPFLLKAC